MLKASDKKIHDSLTNPHHQRTLRCCVLDWAGSTVSEENGTVTIQAGHMVKEVYKCDFKVKMRNDEDVMELFVQFDSDETFYPIGRGRSSHFFMDVVFNLMNDSDYRNKKKKEAQSWEHVPAVA